MKFRFGIQFTRTGSLADWLDTARKAEDSGFSTLLVPDHLGDQFAPFPALTAAAGVTSTLRLGTLVLANDFRHPVLLAQEAATLDLLSGGRLELGLGAGWMRSEYESAGLPFDSSGTRVERLGESLELLRLLWEGGPVSFEGRHYRTEGHVGLPSPVQSRLPLLVGGGSPRILRTAGRHADIVGVHHDLRSGAAGALDTTPDMTARKLQWVRQGAGDRFADLELQVGVGILWVTARPANVLDGLGRRLGLPADTVAELPNVLVGDTGQIIERLIERRDRYGFSYVVFQGRDLEDALPVVAALAGC
ncbi:TIGR03621 family F420-dependent LLM class oxidoreductase [Actinocorallia sp. B10E7]|uniref:TIGR03621 family F420-dependent LLM class oxidoreductase n=1 Tax=Actinocorallia sp. B10E7 TaxID=3153558 RepID=UPI00325D774E